MDDTAEDHESQKNYSKRSLPWGKGRKINEKINYHNLGKVAVNNEEGWWKYWNMVITGGEGVHS